MPFNVNDFLVYKYSSLTFLVLAASLIGIWVFESGAKKLQLFFIFVVFGLMSQHLSVLGVLAIAIYGAIGWVSFRSNWHGFVSFLFYLAFLVISVGLFLHKVPGIYNWELAKDMVLGTTGARPYSLWFNLDKPLIAFFGLLWAVPYLDNWQDIKFTIKKTLLPFVMMMLVVPYLSVKMGFVTWDPKWQPDLFAAWIFKNLFLVVLAEEVIFRGFIQMRLRVWMERKGMRSWPAVLVAGILFGLAHYAGGWNYVFLSSLAGICYGWAQYRSQAIEAAIFLHLSLNTVHFLFFTYPGLA